jgi:predicted solute-binding protein
MYHFFIVISVIVQVAGKPVEFVQNYTSKTRYGYGNECQEAGDQFVKKLHQHKRGQGHGKAPNVSIDSFCELTNDLEA